MVEVKMMTEAKPPFVSAPHLYALSQSARCTGRSECHWCGAPCEDFWVHDDYIPTIGQKWNWLAKRPGNHWICNGCWLFRRPRVTIPFLGGGYKDGKCAMDFSWWITERGAYAINLENKEGKALLYENLLEPPLVFALSLVDKDTKNNLQLAPVNRFDEIKGDTQIHFVLNSTVLSYTPYELEEALRKSPTGKEPGVGALLRMFGPHKLPDLPREAPKPVGRPGKEIMLQIPGKKVVSRSG